MAYLFNSANIFKLTVGLDPGEGLMGTVLVCCCRGGFRGSSLEPPFLKLATYPKTLTELADEHTLVSFELSSITSDCLAHYGSRLVVWLFRGNGNGCAFQEMGVTLRKWVWEKPSSDSWIHPSLLVIPCMC